MVGIVTRQTLPAFVEGVQDGAVADFNGFAGGVDVFRALVVERVEILKVIKT